MPSESTPAVALVIPVYNEEDVLPELLARLTQVFDQERGYAWSAILVNDGSSDRSAELALAANARDSRFKLIELSRNFGFQGALAAGLAAAAQSDAVITMDADLQDPPELLADMMTLMDGGADVVYGLRASRAGESRFKTFTAFVFYRFLSRLTSVAIPQANRSALMRKATSSGDNLRARPRMSGTATAPAYITSTCCSPKVSSFGTGRTSSTGWISVLMKITP